MKTVPTSYKLQAISCSRGFTLVETLVALTLIGIALAGPFVAADRAYVAAMNAQNQLTASYLAQEGVEYVRKLRDDTYLNDYGLGRNDDLDNPPDGEVEGLSNTAFFGDFLDGGNGGSNPMPVITTSIYHCEGVPTTWGNPGQGGDGSKACALDTSLPVGVSAVGGGKALQQCTDVDSCPKLYPPTSPNWLYTLGNGQGTSPFVRSLRLYAFNDEGVQVVSRVSREYRGDDYFVETTSYLTPWE